MGRTATELGREFGRNGAQMNQLLHDHGFLEGKPGAWMTTELGKKFSQAHDFDNGYGGYAYRQWGWLSWLDDVVDALKASIEAHPDGIAPPLPAAASAPATAVSAVSRSATRPGGAALSRHQWAAVTALGIAVAAAPAAGRTWNEKVRPAASRVRARLAERRSASATAAEAEGDAEGPQD